MKYQIFLNICGLFLSNGLLHSTNQERFLQAHASYHDANYQQALEGYEAICNKTSGVWYDIGLCYLKLAKQGHAIWAFKHALMIVPDKKNFDLISRALMQTKKSLGVQADKSLMHRVGTMVRRSTAGTSLLQWQLFLLFWVYGMAFLLWYGLRRRWIYLCVLCCSCGIISSSVVCAIKWTDLGRMEAVVSAHKIEILSGPYQNCHVQGTLEYGQEVLVLERHNDWYKIKSNTILGWVHKNSIMPVT